MPRPTPAGASKSSRGAACPSMRCLPVMTNLPRTAVLIVNARARKGRALFRDACRKLEAAGITLTARHAVLDPSKLPYIVAKEVEKGAEMVIVGGGDGSLSGSVDFLVGRSCVFAMLPFGTANSFARTMGIPLDIDGAIDVIANGRRRRIDLGMIDDDYYANCAAIGMSPLVAETVPHNLKKWFGRAGYLFWVGVQGMRFKSFRLTVGEGPDAKTVDALEVRIFNGSYHGGTELVEAEIDSGEIVVQAVLGNARHHLAWSWLASTLALRAKDRTLCEFRGAKLRIVTDPPLPISIDGEVLAHTPVTARVARGVIEVAAPR